ncbi:MAG: ABC transporter ATP-binding protein [bacterium]
MLEVRGLKARRGHFNLTLDKLHLKANSINLVLGPNGGGKTTLLRSLAGLIPHSGEIILDGKTVQRVSFKEHAKIFGYLSQGVLLSELIVKDFLILGRFPYTGMISKYSITDWDKVYDTAMIFGLEEYLCRDISTLSQGEFQRVLLAKVFIQQPRILLLDEPTTALDIGFKDLVKKQIYKYLEIKPEATVLISTHEPDVFINQVDQVLMLKHGEVFNSGQKSEVYNTDNIKRLFNLS